MPVSAMKFVRIKAPATEDYKLVCFKFGGGFFESEGYKKYDYFAGFIVSSQPSLLVSDTYGSALEAVSKANLPNYEDLAAGWEFIKKNWDKLPRTSLLYIEQSTEGWTVVKAEDITMREVI